MRVHSLMIRCILPFTLLTSACSGTNASSAVKEGEAIGVTTLLRFWDENAGPSRTPYYKELLRRFHEQYPNIEVQYTGIPLSLNKIKYDVAINANDMPDVAGLSETWIADYASRGVLLPLDDYYERWPEHSQIGESFIAYNRSLAPDRKLYQLPNTFNFDVFWYRTDWFREKGLSAPRTWDDFFTAAVQLTNPSLHRYGYSLRGADGSITQLTSLLYAYSGITEYFTNDGRCTINNPKHVEFLNRYISLYKANTSKSDIANGYKEMVAAFDSGRAGIIQHNFGSFNDHIQALGQDKFGAELLPPAQNGKRAMVTVANGYGIFKTSKNPDAAWTLLSFLSSKESQTYWNANVGQMPTNTQAWDSEYIRKTPFLQEALAAMQDERTGMVQVPFYLPNYSSLVKQQLEPELQDVLAGTLTVEQFLNDWAGLMENAYVEYINKNNRNP
ncbi:ABC transporter substrate-binding protein [Paenibacillus sp. UNC451MF]|uniref:ABC transporter substrate-binding protein n=1 Tax=Paenibacillus sp. UNC451MF TaxID=1449063 RepID=UPI001E3A6905|nr:sugar ABC transporter substrate-binding protein [Paenibacillus sp. UNC451MF]